MRIALFLTMAALAGSPAVGQQTAVVTADFPGSSERQRVEVHEGQQLVLRWKNVPPDSVLVGTGSIPVSGEQIVTPDEDGDYTIISTNGQVVEFRTITVALDGRKGPSGAGIGNGTFPPARAYLAENTIDVFIKNVAYPTLIDRTYSYLAQTCGHTIEKTIEKLQDLSDAYTLWTDRIESQDGHPAACIDVLPKDHNIATQPIATSYYLRFYKPADSGTKIEIGALVTSRPLRSPTRVQLADKRYARALAESLGVRLEGVLK